MRSWSVISNRFIPGCCSCSSCCCGIGGGSCSSCGGSSSCSVGCSGCCSCSSCCGGGCSSCSSGICCGSSCCCGGSIFWEIMLVWHHWICLSVCFSVWNILGVVTFLVFWVILRQGSYIRYLFKFWWNIGNCCHCSCCFIWVIYFLVVGLKTLRHRGWCSLLLLFWFVISNRFVPRRSGGGVVIWLGVGSGDVDLLFITFIGGLLWLIRF